MTNLCSWEHLPLDTLTVLSIELWILIFQSSNARSEQCCTISILRLTVATIRLLSCICTSSSMKSITGKTEIAVTSLLITSELLAL
jgi:hypothetical protein